jgi:hypothetical protein
MQWLPDQQGQHWRTEARPQSILDVHFGPPSRFARRTPEAHDQADDLIPGSRYVRRTPETHNHTHEQTQEETQILCPRMRVPTPYPSPPRRPLATAPPIIPLNVRQQKPPRQSREFTSSPFSDLIDSGTSNASTSPDRYYTPSISPPHYKNRSIVTHEPGKRPSSRLHTYARAYRHPEVHEHPEHPDCSAYPTSPSPEAKGKNVA